MSSHAFRAKYPGRCPECGEEIEVGDKLVYTEDNLAVHEVCPDSIHGELRVRETCPRCFTEKALNGSCLCDPEDERAVS